MNRRLGITALMAIAISLAGTAGAEQGGNWFKADDELNRPGFYLGLNGIYAQDFFSDEIEDAFNGLFEVRNSGGLNTRAGYRVTSWFAAEILYEWTKGVVYTTQNNIKLFEQQTDTLVANGKFILPFWRLQPYLNLGIGAQKGDVSLSIPSAPVRSSSGWLFTGRPAFGLDFLASRHWTVNVELAGVLAVREPDSISNAAKNLFYLTVGGGLSYRF